MNMHNESNPIQSNPSMQHERDTMMFALKDATVC